MLYAGLGRRRMNCSSCAETDRDNETTLALSKLDPGRLADQLLATAKDKQLDSYVREGALITLCTVTTHARF
jgi:hypothetical protein